MNLNSRVFGKSENKLIILHGFLGSLDNWITIAKKISDLGFEVHIVDQRNHGKSFHSDSHSYELMALDLKNYIDHFDFDKVSIIGHSMGGKTACCFALNHSTMVEKLIIVDIPYYLLIEMEEKESEKAFKLFESFYEKEWVKDGTLSQNSTQADEIWKLRENISEAIAFAKPYKNDVSVRVSQITGFLKDLNQLLKQHYPYFESVVFGHLGDGNLHINILKPESWKKEDFIKECEKVNLVLFELIQKHEGSISAEHGIGLLKKNYLSYSCSPEEITLMKQIKTVFDPDNILNPGKIFN